MNDQTPDAMSEKRTEDQPLISEELANMPDDQIDTSEIAEILDWSDAKRGVFYRPDEETSHDEDVCRSD